MCGAVLFFLYSYTRPQVFVATSTILPAEHEGMGGMLAVLANANASSALDLIKGDAAASPTLELFKAVVESRSIAEDVATDSAIRTYFLRRDTSGKAIVNALQSGISSEALRTGMLTVTVFLPAQRFASSIQIDSAKVMSAYIANRFVAALDRFNRDRLMTTARNTRIFVEQEYNAKLIDLDSAYGRLQQFQEGHQAISLPEQLAATVTAAGKLTAEMQQEEMQLQVEERELGPNSPRIKTLQAGIEAAKEQLDKYDNGGADGHSAGEYVVALKNAPALSRQLAASLREVKVLEQVTGYLRQQLEQEKVSEQRDLPSLQVLDGAIPPTGNASPKRLVYLIIGLIAGLFLSLIVTYYKRFVRDVREHPDLHYRFINVMSALKRGSHGAKV